MATPSTSFHLPIEALARGLGLHPSAHASPDGSVLPMALLYVAADSAVAWLGWHGFEAFSMRLRRRFSYADARSEAASSR